MLKKLQNKKGFTLMEHPSGLFIRFHHALQSLKSGILTWFF